MTELEKCLAGEFYDCHDGVFIESKARSAEWCERYNKTPYTSKAERYELLKEFFAEVGTNVSAGQNFCCEFGENVRIGSNVSINHNCTFVACNTITIGSNVLIAPGVQLNTATHPVELSERLNPEFREGGQAYFCRTRALPITIGDGCWIGAGAIVLAGVTIGEGTVVGAGSVVTRSLPSNVLAVGSPARPVRTINH